MKCPHCLNHFHPDILHHEIGKDKDNKWLVEIVLCPACSNAILTLLRATPKTNVITSRRMFYPKAPSRMPLSLDVPKGFAEDYLESCSVLPDSAKASAALSRRCLQLLLREVAKVKPSNLADEIQELLDRKTLPSQIAEALDAVRNIGNFAAHPVKSKTTGEVLPVEPGEAEWNLDVLEALFDYYFVQPALLKKKKEALNAKLAEAGKPQIK